MNDRFLRACRREWTDCVPVWFMRQAGRYMEEYRAVRAKHSILEVCKTPELAAQVTLQPIERFPLDAAIIFADILLPLEPMGLRITFEEGEGPVIHNPIRTRADVDALRLVEGEELQFVAEAVRLARRALDGRVPLIGFGTGTATLLELMREAGGTVIGVDWRVPLDEARRRLGPGVAIQGNLDPVVLLAPRHEIERRVESVLKQAGDEPGFIFNLGHGILPTTPVENVQAAVELVHKLSQR